MPHDMQNILMLIRKGVIFFDDDYSSSWKTRVAETVQDSQLLPRKTHPGKDDLTINQL